MEFWSLFAYSEWLDQQGLIVGDTATDRRSHEDLVNQYLAEKGDEEPVEYWPVGKGAS